MRPTPFSDRHGLFAAVYLAWGLFLASFVVSGAYRNFIQPSFVALLWLALAILLVFALAELGHLGEARLQLHDLVRCGFLALPLLALGLAGGRTLDSQAYLKRSVLTGPKTALSRRAPLPAGEHGPHVDGSPGAPIAANILEILQHPKAFEGKWVAIEGMALGEETMRKEAAMRTETINPGDFVLFRFSIVCCVADSQPLGLIVQGAGQSNLVDSNWYRAVGRFVINKDQTGTISQAVVESLKSPPETPYLYGGESSPGSLQN